jgi:hypothetical protein
MSVDDRLRKVRFAMRLCADKVSEMCLDWPLLGLVHARIRQEVSPSASLFCLRTCGNMWPPMITWPASEEYDTASMQQSFSADFPCKKILKRRCQTKPVRLRIKENASALSRFTPSEK